MAGPVNASTSRRANLFNVSTVLGRQYDVTATGNTGFDRPLEIMNPRLLRLGVRWQF